MTVLLKNGYKTPPSIELKNKISKTIKLIIFRNEIPKDELAKELGISNSYLYKITGPGYRKVSLDALVDMLFHFRGYKEADELLKTLGSDEWIKC